MEKTQVDKQVSRLVGRHAQDPCIPWDAEQVPKFRNQAFVTESLQPTADEVYYRHSWVSKGCLHLVYPRERGEELGQQVWLGVFKGLVTPGREVKHLHAFLGGVMANQLKAEIRQRTREQHHEPLVIETEDGPVERRPMAGAEAESVDEAAVRGALVDQVLSQADEYDRILLAGLMDCRKLSEVREALLVAGDLRVTPETPDRNIKTFQNTALGRARKLLESGRSARRPKR